MNKGEVIIISPDGELYFSSVEGKGHAVKLISYCDENNIYYNKKESMFIPSQEFAINLSNMGYIVFLTESSLTCVFCNQNDMFTYEQLNVLENNKELFDRILSERVISFNMNLSDMFNEEDRLNSLISYINESLKIRRR